jgi:hypothetical protein
MGVLSEDALNRLNRLVGIGQTVFHWGFVPTVSITFLQQNNTFCTGFRQ